MSRMPNRMPNEPLESKEKQRGQRAGRIGEVLEFLETIQNAQIDRANPRIAKKPRSFALTSSAISAIIHQLEQDGKNSHGK